MSKSKKIIIYGDSIGKGILWNSERQRYCISKSACVKTLSTAVPFPVENRSVMGCTVQQCLKEFKKDRIDRGALIVFELGSNDCDMPWDRIASDPGHEYPAKVPLHEFYRDFRELIRLARRRHAQIAAVIPLPLDSERYFAWVSRGLDRENILRYLGDPFQMSRWQERYATAVRDVARQEKVKVIDLRDCILKNREFRSLYCEDGIHLNDRGQQLLFDYLKDEGLIPDRSRKTAGKAAACPTKTVCTA